MKSVVVGTAGHIDHGKSSLVLALTGTDPDRLKEEKARGITIELGFAHLVLGDTNLAFVDVPGHERFVKTMLAGVGGIDLVVLVIAADESVMPQTREHFDICRLLRIPAGIVALTKSDLVDADTLELVSLEARELVAGSFLEGAPIVPVSSRSGAGLDALRAALAAAASRVAGRSADGPARLPVDRVFSMKGFGTVVTGTLVSGRVEADDELALLPSDRRVKVRGVQVHGAKRQAAVAGQRTAINVAGVEVAEIDRGDTLVAPGAFEPHRIVDGVLDLLPDARPLKHGTRVRFHQGTAEVLGRVAIIGPLGESRAVPAVEPGGRRYVRLRLERPAVLTRGDRFILRAYSPPVTIGGGQVLDPQPPRGAVRTERAAQRMAALDVRDGADPDERTRAAIELMVGEAAAGGLPVGALVSRVGLTPAGANGIARLLVAEKRVVRIGDLLASPAVLDRVSGDVLAVLAAHHREQPLSEGAPREEVRDRVLAHGRPEIFEHVVDALTAAGRIGGRDKLALASHRVALTPEEEKARAAIERVLRESGLTPPDAAALATAAGATPPVVDRVLKLLQRQKIVVRVDTLLFHDESLKTLKRDVAALKGSGAPKIDVATFKERFGVSRKYAIPLLEYLDRERVTRRMGDARVIL